MISITCQLPGKRVRPVPHDALFLDVFLPNALGEPQTYIAMSRPLKSFLLRILEAFMLGEFSYSKRPASQCKNIFPNII
jgi:hypothetical protein